MSKKPNFLIIMTDQHNPHVLGAAGDDVVRTPNLDKLAKTGVRFTNAYCPQPLCVPSRMSFMTSRYPGHNCVWTNGCVLSSSVPTFAHSLGAGGYEAVLSGRMHFRGPDQLHGFQKRLVGDLGPTLLGAPGIELFQLRRTAGQSRESVQNSGPGQTGYQLYDKTVTDASVKYLKEKQGSEKPFCLVVGYVLPHCPFVCPLEDFEYYYDRVKIPEYDRSNLHPVMQQWMKRRGIYEPPLAEAEIRRARAAYYGLVNQVDRNVGRLLEALSSCDLQDNTVVIYTSDHGDMAGEHGLWWKSNFYEGSVGIPLIVKYPEVFQSDIEVNHNVSLIDIAPTLIELTGSPELPYIDGRSLLEGLKKGHFTERKNEIISEEFRPRTSCKAMRMVRSGEWKLMYYYKAGYQLFNLEEDPNELMDRSGDPRLKGLLDSLIKKATEDWNPEGVEKELQRRSFYNRIHHLWFKSVSPLETYRWKQPPGAYKLDYDWPKTYYPNGLDK